MPKRERDEECQGWRNQRLREEPGNPEAGEIGRSGVIEVEIPIITTPFLIQYQLDLPPMEPYLEDTEEEEEEPEEEEGEDEDDVVWQVIIRPDAPAA